MVQKRGYWVASILIIVVMFTLLVIAEHTITSITATNFNEDVTNIYNITVNNTDLNGANITQVNITLPSSFNFTAATNETSAGSHEFSNTSTIQLTWNNSIMLVANFTARNFKFNATATNPGTYNITVTTLNSTSVVITNIAITINDTTVPSDISFQGQTPATRSNLSQSNIPINITTIDNGGNGTIRIYLFNSTHGIVNNTNLTTNPAFLNITSLADGIYYLNATANDTAGNQQNLTTGGTRNITLDTTLPVPLFGNGTANNSINVSRNWIYVNVSVTEINEMNITFTLYNATTLVNRTTSTSAQRTINWTGLGDSKNYSYNVTVGDYAANINTTATRTITLDTTAPVADLSCSPTSAKTDQTITCSCTSTDNIDISPTISYTANPSSSNTGTYTTTCTSTDDAGNIGSDEVQYVVEIGGSSPGGGGGGGGTPTDTTYKNTYLVTNEQFNAGFAKDITKNERFRVIISSQDHHVAVLDITSSTVKVEISSTIQTAILSIGETKKFEVTDDTYYDMSVTLNSINNTKAKITVKAISEKIPAQQIPPSEEQTNDTEETTSIPEETAESKGRLKIALTVITILVILAIAIVIVFLIRSKK